MSISCIMITNELFELRNIYQWFGIYTREFFEIIYICSQGLTQYFIHPDLGLMLTVFKENLRNNKK